MIICINGKSIGSMTLPELQIEVDVCGSEMLLVVSRFDIQETDSLKELTTLEDLAMDWSDIGAGAILKTTRVSFEDDRSSGGIREQEIQMNGGVVEPTKHVGSICDSAGTGPHPSLGSYGQAYISKCLPVPAQQMKRAVICGICTNCKRDDCGTCKACIDKPKFGGPNKMKQKCYRKICHHMTKVKPSDKNEVVVHGKTVSRKGPRKPGPGLSEEERMMSELANIRAELDANAQTVNTCVDKTAHPPLKKKSNKHLTKQDIVNGAASGCKKCMRQLETSVRDKNRHCLSCPNAGGKKEGGVLPPPRLNSSSLVDDTSWWCHNPNCGRSNHASKKQCSDCSSWKVGYGPSRGNDGSAAATTTTTTTKKKPVSRYQKQLEELSDDGSDVSSGDERDDFDDDDENPWLGCVCGNSHPNPIKVFWIQCELCDAWYNVAEECVGFNEEAASTIDKWCCWACNPPVAGLGL